VPERRETKQEKEARKLEKERVARARERERSIAEEHVDGGFLVTMGVYTGIEDFSKAIVRQLTVSIYIVHLRKRPLMSSRLSDGLRLSGGVLMISTRNGQNINWLLRGEVFPSLPRMRYLRKS
jgi:hypothetical protein